MNRPDVLLFENNKDIVQFINIDDFCQKYNIFTTENILQAGHILERNKIKIILSSSSFLDQNKAFFKKTFENNSQIWLILFTPNNYNPSQESLNFISRIFQIIPLPINKPQLILAINLAVKLYDENEENKNLLETTKNKMQSLELSNKKMQSVYHTQLSMSSTISHELRTPLAAMKMAIDIVLSGTTGDLTDDQRRFLKKAKDNIDRLKRLIDAVLDISKLESGRVNFNFKYNDINKTIKEVAASQELITKDKGLYLKINLDPEMIIVPFDEDRITQVLNNLINNAIKFTHKGGIILSSSCNKKQNHIQIIIKDTGIGIPEEDIPKLFKKFTQLGDPETRKSGGTGLGLSICEEILKNHGGKIWIESKPGNGTSVYLNLPIEERRKAE